MPNDAEEPEESGLQEARHAMPRRTLLREFFRPGKGQLIAGVVLFVTALLVTWTLRSQDSQPEFAQARQEELVQLLDTVTSQNRALEAELRELQSNRDELVSGADRAQTVRKDAERRLEQLQILSGTVAAHGPGVRITVTAPDGKLTPELMLNAIEELRDAGAEVIELNDDIRVVMSTAFTADEEGRLAVDGKPLRSPLVIEAIGDPSTLEAGARFRGGLVSEVEGARVGGNAIIEQLDDVQITSLAEPAENKFARPR